MKAILYFVLFFLGIASIGITFIDIVSNSYYKEFDNIKSLKNKEEYMTIDYLLIQKTHDRNEATADGIRFDIEGVLISNGSHLRLSVGYKKYINFNLEHQPLYKSKLTGDYFLKNAPEKYYEGKYRGIYGSILLKIAFYFIMPFLIYQLIKYFKNRKYRL